MAFETTVLSVRVKLSELQKEITDSALKSQIGVSIEELKSSEGQESNGLSLELLRAVYRAEDIIDTFLKEISQNVHQQQNRLVKAGIDLRSAYIKNRFSNEMKELVGAIKEESSATKSRKKLELKGTKSSRRLPVEDAAFNNTSETGDSNKKTGMLDLILKDEVKGLAELILSDYRSPLHIPVVDVAGSAETPELWKIYNCDDIRNHFQRRAWFLVPPRLDKRELAMDILRQFARTDVELEGKLQFIESPQTEVHNYLIHKRYLVILTDVRTPDIWEILRFLFPNSLIGSRVILSFREADAAMHRNLNFFGGDLNLNFKEKKALSALNKAVVVGDDDDDVDTIQPQISVPEILGQEAEMVGLEDQLLRLAQRTMNGSSKYFLISVAGVAGSGKTTLVKTIYNSSYIRQNFECHAWANVYVSHDFDLRKILIDILEQVRRAKVEKELALNELESRLIRFVQSKRYLIVLDDVHLPGAWYELQRIFSPNTSSSGSRVILVTREAFVARAFSPSIILLQVRLLKADESWKLFLKMVERDERDSELLNLKEKIWKKCGGLPLAICVLGGLLQKIQDSEWEEVIEGFTPGGKKKEKQSQHVDQVALHKDQSSSRDELSSPDNLEASSIWSLGYKYLPAHLKACLHYLCLFPQPREIPVRRLLQLWLAERFVTPSERKEMSPEDRAEEDFKQLAKRHMIDVVKRRSDETAKTCRVPNTLYDTFQNAEKMGFYLYPKAKSDSASSLQEVCVRRLSEHLDNQNDSIPPDKYIEYLHSYLSFDDRMGDKPADTVGNLLNKMINRRGYRLLRVLDLEGVYKPELPETIGKLRLLRYIGLRWTFLDSIPESVGDLPSLETLDLKHTNITSLPKSIWKVKTLRHLYMNDIYFSVQKPFVKYSLTKLQTLWGLLIGNKSPPLNWLNSLSGLKKLGLTCHIASLGQITKWIQERTGLKSLRLRSINDFGEPSDLDIGPLNNHEALNELYLLGKLPEPLQLDKLPPNLGILTLSLSYLSEDPMPVLGQLKELKILRLFAHSYMGEEMTCGDGGFPKLRVLKLWVLKELTEWTISKKAMPELRKLEIRCCKKLKKPIDLEKVSSLEELTLTDMKKSFEDEVRRSMAKTVNIVINPPGGKNTHGVEALG